MMRIISLLLISIFLVACGEESQAGADEGLYAPKAPENAAFVRVFNARDTAITAKAGTKEFGEIAPMSASPYYFYTKDSIDLTVDEQKQPQDLEAGAFYTVIAQDGLNVITDTANSNPAKATISFYNQSSAPVTIKAKENTVAIFKDVASMDQTAREINPVKVDLTLNAQGNDTPMPIETIIMERDNHYAILFNGDQTAVFQAQVDTTK